MNQLIHSYFKEAEAALTSFSTEANFRSIEKAADLMVKCLRSGGKIISCGNGGSMCDAMHFAEELTGRYRDDRPSFAAISISDPSHLSCVGNDYGYDKVFSRFIEGMGEEDDVLLGISTSGNSVNVLNAIEAARVKGMTVIGLTGKNGGKMAGLCDVEVRGPDTLYADHIQEIHIKVIHMFIQLIERGME